MGVWHDSGNTNVATHSIGFARGVSNGIGGGAGATTQGSSNLIKSTKVQGPIGGHSSIAAPAYNNSFTVMSLNVTVWSQGSGVSIQPNTPINGSVSFFVLG
jgi:hypothetical protein